MVVISMLRRVAPLLLAAACTSNIADVGSDESSIIGGTIASRGQFPTTGVMLFTVTDQGQSFGSMLCTGTLIAPDVVLTAAHCVDDTFFPGGTVNFYFSFARNVQSFGVNDISLPPNTYPVAELIGHENFVLDAYMPGLFNYWDVGLLFLAVPVQDRTPAVISDAADAVHLTVGTSVDIVGYGQTTPEGGEFGKKMRAVSLINEINAWEMQIGDLPPVPQKCHGDSGGPTYIDIQDNRLPVRRLIGVTSRAYDESDCYKGGVDMRADAFRPWIQGQMIAGCQQGRRVAAVCAQGPGLASPMAMGPTPDAGFVDSGPPPPPPDSGPRDTGVKPPPRDTGVTPPPPPMDAGTVAPDAGFVAPPPLALEEAEPVACGGCTAADRSNGSLLWLLLLAGLLLRRPVWPGLRALWRG